MKIFFTQKSIEFLRLSTSAMQASTITWCSQKDTRKFVYHVIFPIFRFAPEKQQIDFLNQLNHLLRIKNTLLGSDCKNFQVFNTIYFGKKNLVYFKELFAYKLYPLMPQFEIFSFSSQIT